MEENEKFITLANLEIFLSCLKLNYLNKYSEKGHKHEINEINGLDDRLNNLAKMIENLGNLTSPTDGQILLSGYNEIFTTLDNETILVPDADLTGTSYYTLPFSGKDVYDLLVKLDNLPEQGIQGPEGPMGPTGPTGPIGPRGKDGVAGSQGPKGDMGPMGPQGVQGNVGPTGPKGDTGDRGLVGPTGPKGDTGSNGKSPILNEVKVSTADANSGFFESISDNNYILNLLLKLPEVDNSANLEEINDLIQQAITSVVTDYLDGHKFKWLTSEQYNSLSYTDPKTEYHITDAEAPEVITKALVVNESEDLIGMSLEEGQMVYVRTAEPGKKLRVYLDGELSEI